MNDVYHILEPHYKSLQKKSAYGFFVPFKNQWIQETCILTVVNVLYTISPPCQSPIF